VDSHMFQHVGCRLKGCLTDLVHADRVPTIVTRHESAAGYVSGRSVHALSLRLNRTAKRVLGPQPETLVLFHPAPARGMTKTWAHCVGSACNGEKALSLGGCSALSGGISKASGSTQPIRSSRQGKEHRAKADPDQARRFRRCSNCGPGGWSHRELGRSTQTTEDSST
jgi:hypothetical protein